MEDIIDEEKIFVSILFDLNDPISCFIWHIFELFMFMIVLLIIFANLHLHF